MTTTPAAIRIVRIVAPIAIGGLLLTQSLTGAGPAHATTPQNRYAAPKGVDDSSCAHAHPCTITGAIAIAQSGDTVILESGSYGSAAAPLQTSLTDNGASLTIRGQTTKPSVRIYSAAPDGGIYLGGTSSLSGVTLMYSGDSTALGLGYLASADRIVVVGGQSVSTTCSVLGSLTNAVCWEQASSGRAILVESIGSSPPGDISLRNVDAIAPGASGLGIKLETYEGQATLDVTNTIAEGGEADIYVSADDSSSSSVMNLGHSAFITHEFGDFSSPGTQTINTDPSGIEQRPKLVDVLGGNFHEKASSKTVDHGVSSAANGALDVAGQLRNAGTATDIGAYEFQPRPQLGHLKITKRKRTSIVATVKVQTGKLPARIQLLGYGGGRRTRHGVVRVVATGRHGKTVKLVLGKLHRHTTYRLSATVHSAGGKATTKRSAATTR